MPFTTLLYSWECVPLSSHTDGARGTQTHYLEFRVLLQLDFMQLDLGNNFGSYYTCAYTLPIIQAQYSLLVRLFHCKLRGDFSSSFLLLQE